MGPFQPGPGSPGTSLRLDGHRAALDVGCRFVGIELDEGYVTSARARLAA